MKNLLTALVILLVVILMLAGCSTSTQPQTSAPQSSSPSQTQTSSAKLPPLIIAISHSDPASVMVTRMIGFKEAIEKFTSMKVKIEPADTDLVRFTSLQSGEAALHLNTASTVYQAMTGSLLKQVGPIKIRRAWLGAPGLFVAFSRGDAGFKAIADLKGKRIPQCPGALGWSKNVESVLAFGGLTLKDVQVVNVAALGAGMSGVIEGTVDMAWGTSSVAAALELASSRHGVHLFEFPAVDKAGWDRLRAVEPTMGPGVAKHASGLPAGKTLETPAVEQSIYSSPETSVDIIYAVCKAMKEGYDTYKNMEPALIDWTWEQARAVPTLEIPYHDGTIKYLKEVGAWTDAHEKFQQNALNLEKTRFNK